MTKIIQFPRPLPGRRWSPSEILAIKEPADSRAKYRQERSALGVTEAVAANATNREERREKRKKAIVDTLADQRLWTVIDLTTAVGSFTGETISHTTVMGLLRELENEGLTARVKNKSDANTEFWKCK
jgi:hypothetical protein